MKKAKNNRILQQKTQKEELRDGDIEFIRLPDLNMAKIAFDNLEKPKENSKRNCFWLYGENALGKTSLFTEFFWADTYFKDFRKGNYIKTKILWLLMISLTQRYKNI